MSKKEFPFKGWRKAFFGDYIARGKYRIYPEIQPDGEWWVLYEKRLELYGAGACYEYSSLDQSRSLISMMSEGDRLIEKEGELKRKKRGMVDAMKILVKGGE